MFYLNYENSAHQAFQIYELAEQIFCLAADNDWCVDGNYPSYVPIPLRIGRVSRDWRHIALACPKLWSTIRIRIGNRSWTWTPDREYIMSILSLYLRRSHPAPLSLSVEYRGKSQTAKADDITREVFASLAIHKRRWIYLDLHIVDDSLLPPLGDLPSLEHISIYIKYPSPKSPSVSISSAPSLRSLEFHYGTLNKDSLPWAQMRSVTLNSSSNFDYSAFSLFHNLHSFTLTPWGRFGLESIPKSLTMESVSYLRVDDLLPYLSSYTFPNLKTLIYTPSVSGYEPLPNDLPHLVESVISQSPSFSRLHLCLPSAARIFKVIQSSSVTTLVLQGSRPYSSNDMEFLTLSRLSRTLPKLQAVWLDAVWYGEEEVESLLDFLFDLDSSFANPLDYCPVVHLSLSPECRDSMRSRKLNYIIISWNRFPFLVGW